MIPNLLEVSFAKTSFQATISADFQLQQRGINRSFNKESNRTKKKQRKTTTSFALFLQHNEESIKNYFRKMEEDCPFAGETLVFRRQLLRNVTELKAEINLIRIRSSFYFLRGRWGTHKLWNTDCLKENSWSQLKHWEEIKSRDADRFIYVLCFRRLCRWEFSERKTSESWALKNCPQKMIQWKMHKIGRKIMSLCS